MTLGNFVKLETNIETVLRIREGSFRIEPRNIVDPLTKVPKVVHAASMDVTEENGQPVQKTFSVLSEKLAAALQVGHNSGQLYRFRVGIKRVGSGYATEYQIRYF